MTQGAVSHELFAIVRLTLVGVHSREEEVEAAIDTGFNGHLTLPLKQLQSLGWHLKQEEEMQLGDGSKVMMTIYRGIVMWNGVPRIVSVAASEYMPLLGTALLENNELNIQFKRGGSVSITPLP